MEKLPPTVPSFGLEVSPLIRVAGRGFGVELLTGAMTPVPVQISGSPGGFSVLTSRSSAAAVAVPHMPVSSSCLKERHVISNGIRVEHYIGSKAGGLHIRNVLCLDSNYGDKAADQLNLLLVF